MTPTYGDFVMIKLFVGAFLTPRLIRPSSFVMQHLEAAIMDQLRRLGKYLIVGSIDPPFSRTLTNSSPPAKISNDYSYILLVVKYVSRWVEAITTKINDAKVVVNFLKSNIFCRFGVPKVLISDQGSHFCNKAMSYLLHMGIATAYHPQTNNQAEVFNMEIKKTLQKMTNPNQKDWCRFLEDALWAHRTAYQTLLGMSPYQIVFDKAFKRCNLAYDQARKQRKFQLQELDEHCLETYENSRIYKQKERVPSRLESTPVQFTFKAHCRWDGPFVITNAFPYGAVKLRDERTNNTFQVNGHQIKLFCEGPEPLA
ncbi:Gag-Pol polyprotein, partial [Mucuna pruriens]